MNDSLGRLASLFLSEDMADLYVVVGCKGGKSRRFPCHKLLVASASSKLRSLINSVANGEELHLRDVEPTVFETVLRYLYTEKVQFEMDIGVQVLRFCRNYALPTLLRKAMKAVTDGLVPENLCRFLPHADEFPELRHRLWHLTDSRALEAFDSQSFFNLDAGTMQAILRRDTLDVDEHSLYLKLVKWAYRQCEVKQAKPTDEALRGVLGVLLYDVRFCLLTKEQLNDGPDRLLPKKKYEQLLNCRDGGGVPKWTNPQPRMAYSSQYVCRRYTKSSYKNFQVLKSRFSVSKRIYVTGFELCISGRFKNLTVRIELRKNDELVSSAFVDLPHGCAEPFWPFMGTVQFDGPQVVDPNVEYEASAELFKPLGVEAYLHDGVTSKDNIKCPVKHGGDVLFRFSQPKPSHAAAAIGEIYGIRFFTTVPRRPIATSQNESRSSTCIGSRLATFVKSVTGSQDPVTKRVRR